MFVWQSFQQGEFQPLSDRVLSQGKPCGGQRCVAVYRLCLFREEEEMGTMTVCDISICLLIGRKVGESSFVFCMRTGQEHRGWTVWGKLLLYDARRWVSEQWVTRHTGARGRTGLRPRHQRTLAKLAKVGRAEIREVKIDIRSGYCNNCANWNKLRSEGYEDGNKTIRLLSAGDSSESVTQQLL